MCFEQDHVAVPGELDLVEEEDQITHLLRLEEAANAEDILSKSKVFSMETIIFTCYRLMLISLVMFIHLVLLFPTDIFKFDPNFLENEEKYKEIKRGL